MMGLFQSSLGEVYLGLMQVKQPTMSVSLQFSTIVKLYVLLSSSFSNMHLLRKPTSIPVSFLPL